MEECARATHDSVPPVVTARIVSWLVAGAQAALAVAVGVPLFFLYKLARRVLRSDDRVPAAQSVTPPA